MDKTRNKKSKHSLIHCARLLKHKLKDAYVREQSARIIALSYRYQETIQLLRGN